MLTPAEEVELLRLLEAERRDSIWAAMSDGQRYVVEKIANAPCPRETMKHCNDFELRFILQYCKIVEGVPKDQEYLDRDNESEMSLDEWEAAYVAKQLVKKKTDDWRRGKGMRPVDEWEEVEVRPGLIAWQSIRRV